MNDNKKLYVCDTNVLLNNKEFTVDYNVVITSAVMRELEKHKISPHDDLAYNARVVTRYLKQNKDRFIFDTKNYDGSELGKDYSSGYQDDNLLATCLDENNNYGLITEDVLLQMKAKGLGIEVIDPDDSNVGDNNSDYTGVKHVTMSHEEMADFYSNTTNNTYNLIRNQYLIISNDKEQVIDKRRWNGYDHVELKLPNRRVIEAKNDLQACAIDLLNNKDIPIKIIAGTYGSGKTFLATKMGVYHTIIKGDYANITMIRNPIGSGESVGFLPGTLEEKTEGFFESIVQHLDGGEQDLAVMEMNGQIKRQIPNFIKGLTISNSYILFDESADLSVKMAKLVGTRLGEGSTIAFTGDYNQAEDKYKSNNGMKRMIENLQGNRLVGIVVLDEDIRSDASKLFAEEL